MNSTNGSVQRPTVFLVDSHQATERTLARLAARRDFDFVWFRTATEFLEHVVPEQRGCVVLETRIRDMSGLELQEVLNLREIRLPLIFLTEQGDIRTAVRAVKAGAQDFLQKPVREDELWNAIACAIETQATETRRRQHFQIIETLPPEQREVLEFLAQGCSNRDIARRLDLSVRTIELRRSRAMKQLGARSVVELLVIALECNRPSSGTVPE
jgi:two-component system, LuxR family, response regulator FixJ